MYVYVYVYVCIFSRRIALPLCCTLEQLHGLGFIVQDIKPANVLLNKHDMPVLADFGYYFACL